MSNPSESQAQQVVVNKMTQAQYDQITPSNTEFYLIVDANASAGDIDNSTITLNQTSNKIQTAAILNDRDKTTALKLWEGTKAQYDALVIPPGDTWSTAAVDTNLAENECTAVAYGGSKFVVLGVGGYVSTSTDGITWTSMIEDPNLSYDSSVGYVIAYGNNKFVAINPNGVIFNSADGVTWGSSVGNVGFYYCNAITYDGTKFVALGHSGYYSTSTDGITWTQAVQDSNLGSNSWKGISYGNGKFVAIGAAGYVSTSTNGTTWTTASQDTNLGNRSWGAVVYNGAEFIALSAGGYVSTSTDGITWTAASQDTNLGDNEWIGVAYNGSTELVAIGQVGHVSISEGEPNIDPDTIYHITDDSAGDLLYDTTGDNVDGAMTQKATTDALSGRADVDLANVTNAGNIKMAGASMPSDTYEEITLGASGATYTAPSDGFYVVRINMTGQWSNITLVVNNSGRYCGYCAGALPIGNTVSVKKGDVLTVYYAVESGTPTKSEFRFYYAVGSESEAS